MLYKIREIGKYSYTKKMQVKQKQKIEITYNEKHILRYSLPVLFQVHVCMCVYIKQTLSFFTQKKLFCDFKKLLSTLDIFPSHVTFFFYVFLWVFILLYDYAMLYFAQSLLSNIQLVSIFIIVINSAAENTVTASYLPGTWRLSALIQAVFFNFQ